MSSLKKPLYAVTDADIRLAMTQATKRIAPVWPLDRFIAVNPWWGMTDLPFLKASQQLEDLNNSQTTMPLEWYREAFKRGDITEHALKSVLQSHDQLNHYQALIDEVPCQQNITTQSRLLLSSWIDIHDKRGNKPPISNVLTHAIGQHCASWFDTGQAIWQPVTSSDLYETWLNNTAQDHGLAMLMGVAGLTQRIKKLPRDYHQLIVEASLALQLNKQTLERYFSALLLSINGWASWCAYLQWQAQQQDKEDNHLQQLLAIRLAWEWVLADLVASPDMLTSWYDALLSTPKASKHQAWIWQEALELSWQTTVHQGLVASQSTAPQLRPKLQAVFCIDVRSEPLRRALETCDAQIQTHGFAGFFGLPIEYLAPALQDARPQLPALLKPSLRVKSTIGNLKLDSLIDQKVHQRLRQQQAWQGFRTSASGGFGFVESMGLSYLWKLIKDTLAISKNEPFDGLTSKERTILRPELDNVSIEQAAELAASVLKAMSLEQELAPWVLLTGHSSQTVNNPYAAGLDCGACCGQSGEVNVRVLAALLNNPQVRHALQEKGIYLPVDTVFVAALHNTTTDEIKVFDIPSSILGQLEWAEVSTWLKQATHQAQLQRAASLGIAPDSKTTAKQILRRAHDWSELRPEWGLANNAGFIAAPRHRSKDLNLQGRCFLHDYCYHKDEQHKVLELILTAPVIVAHWINFQYYASTVDNLRWGSGNKMLHNVVGGNIGVFEGNGGDLRVGLPIQSLHDGQRWMHQPLRLSVWIEAPKEAIENILNQHDIIKKLVLGEWLYLFSIEPETQKIYRRLAKDGTIHQSMWDIVSV